MTFDPQHITLNDAEKDTLTDITLTLITASTPNPPGDTHAAANAVTTILTQHLPSSTISTHDSAPHIRNILARLPSGRPGKRLIFSGHLDTYPYGDLSSWTYPADRGTLSADGTQIYGRGSADMQGGIAASIMAMKKLAALTECWRGEVVLCLAGDEESLGTLGAGWMLDEVEGVRGDAMVCGDAGAARVVRAGEKGLVWVNVVAKGVPAHGAHVHRGVNAIDRLRGALDAVKGLEGHEVVGPVEVGRAIDAASGVLEELSGKGESEVLKKITVNIGTISGGISPNLVPASAEAALDIRLPMGIAADDVVALIQAKLSPMEGVSFEVIRKYDATWTSPSEEIVRASCAAVREVLSQEPVVNMRVGASDARLFRAAGIPSVVVGLTPNNMGGPDEFVTTKELEDLVAIHTGIALRYLA